MGSSSARLARPRLLRNREFDGDGASTAVGAFDRHRPLVIGRNAVLTYLNALQGARYVELAELRAANEDFVLGWAQRVAFTFPLTIRKAV